MSTIGLIKSLEKMGVKSCAVCHSAGNESERERLSDAVHGEVLFTPLYWWNKKIRYPLLLRPVGEARQILRTGAALHSSWLVKRAVERWNADLVHSNTMLTIEGALVARFLGIPHVWHVRELIGPDKPFRFWLEGQTFGNFVMAHASKVIANSNATASHIAPFLPGEVLAVVPNGIDLSHFEEFRAAPRSHDKIVVAMVAGLQARWKKHAVFVKSSLHVDRRLPVEFRIYGHDPSEGGKKSANAYIDELHQIIAAGNVADRWTWPGYVADPRQVMSEIDILAHSADHESFGRVIVEGMAARLPVVGANGGGVGEIVVHGKTGLLVPPDDPVAMGKAIEELARDPARRVELGNAGHARAFETYSLEACARGILAVYESAMDRPLRMPFRSRRRAEGFADAR